MQTEAGGPLLRRKRTRRVSPASAVSVTGPHRRSPRRSGARNLLRNPAVAVARRLFPAPARRCARCDLWRRRSRSAFSGWMERAANRPPGGLNGLGAYSSPFGRPFQRRFGHSIQSDSATQSSEDSATQSSRIRPLNPVGFGRRFRAIWPDRRRAATWEANCYWLTGVAVNGVRVFRRESPFKCSR